MSAAPMLPIWWCLEHGDTGNVSRCGWQWMGKADSGEGCEMVQRRLVPVGALVLVRDADGNWPEWAVKAVQAVDDYFEHYADDVLDALAAAKETT